MELEWFKNYLTERLQFVCIGDILSSVLGIKFGVPQGSILGPLLFLLYINDLPSCSNFLSLLFADDTALVIEDDNLTNLFDKANLEFHKVCKFFRLNKLSLHPDKTKYLIISNSLTSLDSLPPVVINNNDVNSTNPTPCSPLTLVKSSDNFPAIKYLGVHFDPSLNFKFHIKQLKTKISRALFTLRRAKHFLPENSLKTLYYSLVHCHLVYAVEIWSCTSQSNLKPLILKQKEAIRIITNSSYNAHTEHLFKALEILPLNLLSDSMKLKFMHSYVQNFLPSAFNNMWTLNRDRRLLEGNLQHLELRSDGDYFVPFSRLDQFKHFPLYNLPNLWNTLSDSITIIRRKSEFNDKIKSMFLSNLSSTIVCNRMLCPSCHLNT